MATRPPLIHPEMLKRLDLFYDKTCTIKYAPDLEDSYDSHGQPQPNYIDLPGHVDIPCALGSSSESGTGGREVKSSDMTYTVSTYKISLKGYYPNIKGNMVAVVNGKTYNILLPEVDSRTQTTRLSVEIVEG